MRFRVPLEKAPRCRMLRQVFQPHVTAYLSLALGPSSRCSICVSPPGQCPLSCCVCLSLSPHALPVPLCPGVQSQHEAALTCPVVTLSAGIVSDVCWNSASPNTLGPPPAHMASDSATSAYLSHAMRQQQACRLLRHPLLQRHPHRRYRPLHRQRRLLLLMLLRRLLLLRR